MIAALEPLQASMGFRLETVDVDDDPLLVRQYNELVPVLTGNGREICHYHLDLAALAAYLNAANP